MTNHKLEQMLKAETTTPDFSDPEHEFVEEVKIIAKKGKEKYLELLQSVKEEKEIKEKNQERKYAELTKKIHGKVSQMIEAINETV